MGQGCRDNLIGHPAIKLSDLMRSFLPSSASFCLCSSSDSIESKMAAPIRRYVKVMTMRLRVRTFCFFIAADEDAGYG